MFEKKLLEELEKKFERIQVKLNEIEEIQQMGAVEDPDGMEEEIENLKEKLESLFEEYVKK